jgi:hypothetical protein
VFGTGGSEVADWVQRACELTVGEGDFFGSGQRPAESHQTVLVPQDWQVRGSEGDAVRGKSRATNTVA